MLPRSTRSRWADEHAIRRRLASSPHQRLTTAYITTIASPDIVHDAPLSSTGSLAALARRAEASGMTITSVLVPTHTDTEEENE